MTACPEPVVQFQQVPAPGGADGPYAALAEAAVDFVVDCRTSDDVDGLLSSYTALIRPLGFEYVAMLDMARGDPVECIRFMTFPPEWLDLYMRDRRWTRDPVWLLSQTSPQAFLWSAAIGSSSGEASRPPLYRTLGMRDGLSLPFVARRSARSVFFLGAVRAPEVDPQTEAILTLTSAVLASRVIEAARPVPDRRLTAREREVLTLTASGRSARDIGESLGMSENTVARHLLNIRARLGAANTVHAVVLAMREGLIET